MRRILATSIAAAIPAVLPVHAADAHTKPAPPPAAGGHYRSVPIHAHGAHARHRSHGRPSTDSRNYNSESGPANDVQVSADDGSAEPQAQDAGGHGATHARPSHARPASRPGTGADTGFSSDADDPELPPEAAQALKEAAGLQGSGQQGSAPQSPSQQGPAPQGPAPEGQAPQGPAPQGPAQPGAAPQGAGQQGAPKGHAPRAPQQHARPVTDESTNQSSGHRAATPVSFFNTNPAPLGSHLVLHTSGGVSPERTVTLQCGPTGGTHPNAAQACADVERASGVLQQMPAGKPARACFMIYAPVTATAQGEWHGQPMRFTQKYPNTCVMRDKTGSVFDF
jgi:hypothetical protein